MIHPKGTEPSAHIRKHTFQNGVSVAILLRENVNEDFFFKDCFYFVTKQAFVLAHCPVSTATVVVPLKRLRLIP